MGTYTIGEVAERSGFSASALRYYEGIGLVVPADRTEAGYRLYDDAALARLAFIARAKQLGCTLEEITDLTSLWDGEACGPVQHRLHGLVAAKIDDARREIAALAAFAADLEAAAAALGHEPIDGPCRDGCACMSAAAAAVPGDAAIACSLEPAELPGRLADWRAVLALARSRSTSSDGTVHLVFDAGIAVDELARLVAAERACCAFFSFTLTIDAAGVALDVRAPTGAGPLLDRLFLP